MIRLLSDDVIGKIAAGEVVERPASAIKELVENSLDAGASAVTVEIQDGGISYFRVTDNGRGIESSDIRMAFERHATSKLSCAEDLFSVATLGFRGEALASIAAVSKVTLITHAVGEPEGIKAENAAGVITDINAAARNIGTTITVRDLFFNTPVRRKFLKKPSAETAFISDLMMNLILSRPDVSFRFISNGKTVYHSAGDGLLSSAVHAIYGAKVLATLREVNGCAAGMVIKGYVGIGENARGNRNAESFFINGRIMRSVLLSGAVETACRERVMIGRFPLCILQLTVPYEMVDINVHPNKLEVRFSNEQSIAEGVTSVVAEALREPDVLARPTALELVSAESGNSHQRESDIPVNVKGSFCEPVYQLQDAPVITKLERLPEEPVNVNEQPAVSLPVIPAKKENVCAEPVRNADVAGMNIPGAMRMRDDAEKNRSTDAGKPNTASEGKKTAEAQHDQTDGRAVCTPSFFDDTPKPINLIGVVFNTYILAEYRDHLLMIDQHAVHERLLFDRMMKTYDKTCTGQELLVPILMNVTRREQQLLQENSDILSSIGLVIDSFGDTDVSIRTVPMILGEAQTVDLVREVIADLEDNKTVTMEKRRSAILQMACKKAVKGGDALTESDIRYLVEEMIDRKVTPTCPHGRPLIVSLSHTELDKKFKRIQT